MDQPKKIILHLDLDYFFAQIEETKKPSLKGKPLVICVYSARGNDSGAVGTANYEARKLGIHSGMPIAFAKKRADNSTVFLPVDMQHYKQVSQRIMQAIREFGGVFEQAGIDEAYLDVTEKSGNSFENAAGIALKIKRKILEQEKLSLSTGIAPNKLVAKIASGHKKPDGLTVVKETDVKKFLFPLAVSKIPGAGTKTCEQLEKMNIRTIEELSKANPTELVQLFGKARGTFLHNASQGIGATELVEGRESTQVSRITTLKKDSQDFEEIFEVVKYLCLQVAQRLLAQKKLFKTAGLIAVTTQIKTISKAKTLPQYSQGSESLENACRELLKEFLKENHSTKIRRIGVRATNFSDASAQSTEKKHQKSLAEY